MNYITLNAGSNQAQLLNVTHLYQYLSRVEDKRQARGRRYEIPQPAALRKDNCKQKQLIQFLHHTYGGQQSILLVMDGKTLRGTIPTGETQGVHLLVVYLPEEGLVLVQIEVGSKENEISAAPKLLEIVDLKGRVVSGDAMFAQRTISLQILAQGGDYIWQLKGNQPTPAAPGWHKAPTRAVQTNKTHGRLERRCLTLVPDEHGYVQWLVVQQCFQLEWRVYGIHVSNKKRLSTSMALPVCHLKR